MSRSVLIIDDDPLIRESTRMVLRTAGYDVTCAGNATEGMATARSLKPDVILLDVMMPDVDGWDALDEMLDDDDVCGIPVIVFTAREHTRGRQLARERGAADYVQKPFEPDQLIDLVRHHAT